MKPETLARERCGEETVAPGIINRAEDCGRLRYKRMREQIVFAAHQSRDFPGPQDIIEGKQLLVGLRENGNLLRIDALADTFFNNVGNQPRFGRIARRAQEPGRESVLL